MKQSLNLADPTINPSTIDDFHWRLKRLRRIWLMPNHQPIDDFPWSTSKLRIFFDQTSINLGY